MIFYIKLISILFNNEAVYFKMVTILVHSCTSTKLMVQKIKASEKLSPMFKLKLWLKFVLTVSSHFLKEGIVDDLKYNEKY